MGVVGVVEQGMRPVVGAVGGPAEGGAEDRRLALLRQDPAELAPALHLVLRVAVLVQAGADRDYEQVVLIQVVGVVAEALQGLDDRDDHRVRGEDAAVHQRVSVDLVRGEVGRGGGGGDTRVGERAVAVRLRQLASAPALEEVGLAVRHVVGADDQLAERVLDLGRPEAPLDRVLQRAERVLGASQPHRVRILPEAAVKIPGPSST